MAEMAIGMIETIGYVGAVAASDAMAKAATVRIVGRHQVAPGLVAIVIEGEVAAVIAATRAGEEAAKRVSEVVSVHVIPKPEKSTMNIIPQTKGKPAKEAKKSKAKGKTTRKSKPHAEKEE